MAGELNDVRSGMDRLSNEKAGFEKQNKQWQSELSELSTKYEDATRTLHEIEQAKKKLGIDNSELSRTLEDVDSQISQLNKLKVSLATQLDEVKR